VLLLEGVVVTKPLLITVRGTSGSGKSTVVRAVMEAAPGGWQASYVPGRRRPLYYYALDPEDFGGLRVAVLGHYEIACGGCDTIGSVPQVFTMLEALPPLDVVLAEGLLLSEDVKWTLAYGAGRARCLFLDTPVNECLRRVGLRQEARGRSPADPARVIRKLTRRVETINRARARLEAAGVVCMTASSEDASGVVMEWVKAAAVGPCKLRAGALS
jgi:hypothetical protein